MGKVNSITKLEIAIFVFLTMMISGASSPARPAPPRPAAPNTPAAPKPF